MNRIKETMSEANNTIGRIGVKSGGCAGMSYIMEYAKEIRPNEEIVEDKGVKVHRSQSCNVSFRHWDGLQKEKFSSQFVFNNPNETERCDASRLKFNRCNTFRILLDVEYVRIIYFLKF